MAKTAKSFVAVHTFRGGSEAYHIYAEHQPSQDEIVRCCGIAFEPAKEEFIELHELDEPYVIPPRVHWTDRDSLVAERQGWGIFNENEIQRIDEKKKFESDDAAMAFVVANASRGCDTCRKALMLVVNPTSEA